MNSFKQNKNLKNSYQLSSDNVVLCHKTSEFRHDALKSVAVASVIVDMAGMPYTITVKSNQNNLIWVEAYN